MKTNKDIENLSERMDSIEKLLKMLVVNSLLDDMNEKEKCCSEADNEISVSDDLVEIIKQYNMTVTKQEVINAFTVVYIVHSNRTKYKTKDYQMLDYLLKSTFEHIIPVFCFESINGMQRKRFVEEDISFCVNNKEVHICSRDE